MHPLAAPGALWVLSRAGKVPRPPAGGRNLSQETAFLRQAGKGPTFLFPVSQRVSPQRRRPGGFPVAPWTPSGPIPIYAVSYTHLDVYKRQLLCPAQGSVPLQALRALGRKLPPAGGDALWSGISVRGDVYKRQGWNKRLSPLALLLAQTMECALQEGKA